LNVQSASSSKQIVVASSDSPVVSEATDEAYERPAAEDSVVESHHVETAVEPASAQHVAEEPPASASAPQPAAQEQPAAEPFVLVAADEPTADVAQREPVAVPVAVDPGEQLAFSLSPAPREEPVRTERSLRRAETEKPVEIRRPSIEVPRPREPDDLRSEGRDSFVVVYATVPIDQAAGDTSQNQLIEMSRRQRSPSRRSPSHRTSQSRRRLSQAQRQPEAEQTSSEPAAPKSAWLADLGEPKPESTGAQSDTPLERIDWPSLSRTADADVLASVPEAAVESIAPAEVATPHVDVAAAIDVETKAPDVAPATDAEPADRAPTDIAPRDVCNIGRRSRRADRARTTRGRGNRRERAPRHRANRAHNVFR
jgi:hypothetical protein